MIEWILNRAADILLALLVITVALWYLLTQPVLSFGGEAPQLGLGPALLDERVQAINSIAETQADKQSRFEATAAYLSQQLTTTGNVRQAERGDNLRIINTQLGDPEKKRLIIGLHYVITAQQNPEIVRTVVSLLELVNLLSVQNELNMQLDLTVFLHREESREALAQGLSAASFYHVDQLMLKPRADDLGLLFTPGLRIPDAVYSTEQWRYFHLLLPSARGDLSLFGRLRDTGRLRSLKKQLGATGLRGVNSLNIPVHFPGVADSPLKFYWDRDIAMLLARANILAGNNDYQSDIDFISALFGLIKQGE